MTPLFIMHQKAIAKNFQLNRGHHNPPVLMPMCFSPLQTLLLSPIPPQVYEEYGKIMSTQPDSSPSVWEIRENHVHAARLLPKCMRNTGKSCPRSPTPPQVYSTAAIIIHQIPRDFFFDGIGLAVLGSFQVVGGLCRVEFAAKNKDFFFFVMD